MEQGAESWIAERIVEGNLAAGVWGWVSDAAPGTGDLAAAVTAILVIGISVVTGFSGVHDAIAAGADCPAGNIIKKNLHGGKEKDKRDQNK